MTHFSKTKCALLASALLIAPAAALAQNDVNDQANRVAEEAQDLQQATNTLTQTVANDADAAAAAGRDGDRDRDHDDDDDGGKWGLLGLLGLAGLLGLKRRDDRHVDRRDYDRTTTTGTTTRGGTRGTDTDTRL